MQIMTKKNKEFERYQSIDQYATRLRQKAENCEFTIKEDEIKSQIIQGCTSRKLRTRCLQDEKTLSDISTMARTMEIADRQFAAVHRHVNRNVGRGNKASHQNQSKMGIHHSSQSNVGTVEVYIHIKTHVQHRVQCSIIATKRTIL